MPPSRGLKDMPTTTPSAIVVLQAGSVAAVCTVDRVFFAAAIDALPHRHPDARHAAAKCLIAGAVLRGDVPGPYDDHEADRLAVILAADSDAHEPAP